MRTAPHATAACQRPLAADLTRVAVAAGLILLAPLVAMQFTSEVNWTASDFAVAALLLAAAGGAFVAVSRTLTTPRTRLLARLALLAGFLLLWAELAVGIVGSPLAGT